MTSIHYTFVSTVKHMLEYAFSLEGIGRGLSMKFGSEAFVRSFMCALVNLLGLMGEPFFANGLLPKMESLNVKSQGRQSPLFDRVAEYCLLLHLVCLWELRTYENRRLILRR